MARVRLPSGSSLRHRVMGFVLAMILLPSILIWGVSNLAFIRINENTARNNLKSALQQTEIILSSHIRSAQTYCEFIAFDPYLISYLRRASYGWLSKAEILDALKYLTNMIDNLQNMSQQVSFRLYFDTPVLLTGERVRFFALSQLPADVSALFRAGTVKAVLPPVTQPVFPLRERNIYTIVQSIGGLTYAHNPLGLVVAYIDSSVLESILLDLEIKYSSTVFVHDETEAFLKRAQSNEALIADYMQRTEQLQDRETLTFAGESYMVLRETMRDTGWTLVTLVPRQAVLEGSYRTATLTLLLSLLFAALATTVALTYFNRMTRRLGDLGENLRSVENGDYGRQIEVGGERELRSLQTSFNSMSRTIRELISERYRTQIQLQYSELKALENQIKPHFLYNTMDVIKFKALRAGAGDVVVLIETLARFFRSTLGSGNRIISLEEEVHHIDLYLQLQNYRFENRISLVQEIPQELRSIPMLRFLLQPLVENAVIHGIQPKSSHCGTIRITASREQDTLRLQVSDDGVGMSPDTLASILVAKGRVYGVQNVHHRIQVFYGKAYGLSYRYSNPDGTCVEVSLPVDYTAYLDADNDLET